ncbi:MAG: hypothetical protein JXM71_12175 [Spirochaetales bacterium]|nr:hypothetical protein [Spirochaetales bacterium]
MRHFSGHVLRGNLESAEYHDALKVCKRLSRTEGIDASLHSHGLHAILAPTSSPAWKTDPVLGDAEHIESATLPAVAGYPNITVPAGTVQGLPVGLSFFSGLDTEAILIRLAQAFEKKADLRLRPSFAATIDTYTGNS